VRVSASHLSTKKRNSPVTRRRVVISGRVQGVFFRDSVRRRAESAGVSGWVRNTPEGAVEAVLEGDPSSVDEMVEFCRRGPSRADVAAVEVVDEELEGLTSRDWHEAKFCRVPELNRSHLLVYAVIAIAVLIIGARWIRSGRDGSAGGPAVSFAAERGRAMSSCTLPGTCGGRGSTGCPRGPA
jgi:acylphosphatase